MANSRSSKTNKKAIVLAKQKRQRMVRAITMSTLAVVAGAAIVLVVLLTDRNPGANTSRLINVQSFGGSAQPRSSNGRFETVTPANGRVVFDAADFSDGKAAYYTADVGGKPVNFFVLKSSDGVIRAAFDACDVCYPARRGYRQEGDFMVCNNCGQQFSSDRINIEKGGCNPSPLDRHVENDTLIIAASDIAKGARYF